MSAALAKLAAPKLSTALRRTRLFERLDALQGGLVGWIVAPPGAGKTTLVASYVEARELPCIWYQCDAGDADVATFFHYVGLAASRLAGTSLDLPVLTPQYAASLGAFSHRFFRELYAAFPRPFALVLDDWHEIPAGSALPEVVRDAAAELPPHVTVLVMSRATPPPAFARLRVIGKIDVIAPDELRLTAEESAAIAHARGVESDGIVASLHQRAEGWAAGLVLLLADASGASALRRGEPIRLLFDYFAGEVLDRMPDLQRRFLLELALLPRFTSGMAVEVCGDPGAARTVADLARCGYFTVVLDAAEEAFGFHPLFREFLLARASEGVPAHRRDTVRRTAAGLLARAGDVDAAVSLLAASGAWEELAALLRRAARRTLEAGRAETLRSWILQLPPELQADPWITLWFGVASIQHGPALARPALERALAALRDAGDAAGAYLAWAMLVDTYLFEWNDFFPLDRCLAAFEDLRRRWPRAPAPEIEDMVTCGRFVALVYRAPGHPELPAVEERVRDIAFATRDPVVRRKLGFALLHLATWRGDVQRCREIIAAVRPRPGEADPFTSVAWHVATARHLFTAGEARAAMEEVDAGLALAHASGVPFLDFALRCNGGLAAVLAGDLDAAERHLVELRKAIGPEQRTNLRFYEYVRGALALAREDLARATEHVAAALEHSRSAGSPYSEGWCHSTLAALAARAGDDAALDRHLGEAERLRVEARSPLLGYWLGLLRAWVALRAGDADGAAGPLRSALTESRRAGPFFEYWLPAEALARLCALALERGIEEDEARSLVQRHGLDPPGGASERWPWPVAIRTLGRFELRVDGAVVQFPRKLQKKPLELLQALVASRGGDASQERLAELLWPDAEGDAAHHALETTTYRLRRLLGANGRLQQQDRRLFLDRARCWADVWALEAALQRAAAARGPDAIQVLLEATREAISVYEGPFLPGDDEAHWARDHADQLRRKLTRHLQDVDRRLSGAGRAADARELWTLRAGRDPAVAPLRREARR
jgi:ATP/maltotriose-dependent transcriptional regulator MalT/DNA-binding SARP family transcriptional activator